MAPGVCCINYGRMALYLEPKWLLNICLCRQRLDKTIFIDREAREIMYLVASVRPSVCLSVCPLPLSRLNRLTYNHHYQSKVIVCVSVIRRRRRIIARMRSIGF